MCSLVVKYFGEAVLRPTPSHVAPMGNGSLCPSAPSLNYATEGGGSFRPAKLKISAVFEIFRTHFCAQLHNY